MRQILFGFAAASVSLALTCMPGSADRQGPSETLGVPDVSHFARVIAAREYEATPSAGGLQAPNRAQNLRTWFGPEGVRVHDRTAPGAPRLASLELRSLGRGGSHSDVAPGRVSSRGARVEIARPGLVEWYQNGPSGLEQGFELETRPAGEGELVLELALDGARASALGDELVLATATGRKLAYGKLEVRDADRRRLEARLEAAEERIRLVVDDSGAAYPVVIDPLIAKTADGAIEPDQESADLGSSLASAGDVNGDGYADAIVGARLYDAGETNEGAAFVFLGSAGGIGFLHTDSAAARIESDQGSAWLGTSVASAGDVNGDGYGDVIVGAPLYSNGEGLEGAAFVFLGSPAGIVGGHPGDASAQLESDQGSAQFGSSVASAGDVNGDGYGDVIVGAPQFSNGQSVEGAAFVFLGSASGIADGNPTTASAQLESDQATGLMGNSVASAGDVNGDGYSDVIVGAYFYTAGQNREGAAFVFHGSATGVADGNPGSAPTQLESNLASSEFGVSVASAGDVNGDGLSDVIVGSRLWANGQSQEGGAFVFLGTPAGVLDGNPLTASRRLEPDLAGAQMGTGVAACDVNGDGYTDLIVGAQYYSGGSLNEGAIFVYLGAFGSASTPPAAFRLERDQAVAALGVSVACGDFNGDGYGDVLAGANLYDAGQQDEGVAFVYLGGNRGILDGNAASAAGQLESNQANGDLGNSVASAGDVNGDRNTDVIVGARLYDSGEDREGAAFIFLGNSFGGLADGNPTTAPAQLESNLPGAELGFSVASAGDVNGDGYGDVIVGAPGYSAGQSAEGAAFVFLGSSNGIGDGTPANVATRLESNQANAFLGTSVSTAGDVNGDGYSDVIVGAPFYANGQIGEGAGFVFLGSARGVDNGNPTTANARLESNQANARLGQSVALAGDVNGDGYADVIIGAPFYSGGQNGEGLALVFLGSANGIPSGNPGSAHAHLESDEAFASFGQSVAAAGDVNGDGYADVIIGAPGFPLLSGDDGAAFVFLGSASGITGNDVGEAATQLESDAVLAEFAYSVSTAGDVNGDGYADVIVGAPSYTRGQNSEGAAFVYLGSATGVPSGNAASARAILESDQTGARFGQSVAAGDLDGDGYADVLVGAPGFSNGQNFEGAAFAFLGNGNASGRSLDHVQGGFPYIQPWGAVSRAYQVDLYTSLRHPQGHGPLSLESEVCPAGARFGSAACRSAVRSWLDLKDQSVYTANRVTGLVPAKLYHWRMRLLYAPLGALRPGIALPPRPAHGPWRRFRAQTVEADFRTGKDGDGDGLDDNSDNCPFYASTNTADTDQDGRGNVCECSDQNGDGLNTVSDLVAINLAIFNPGQVTPLCDGNNDGKCDVRDIVAANLEIFSPGSTSTCARYPVPGPGGPL